MSGGDSFFQPTSDGIMRLLIQIIIVVGLSAVVARIFAFIKQPTVIAQIVTGIILGPTVLGATPDFTTKIFPSQSVAAGIATFNTVADFGLIWFMLLIGLEVDRKLLRSHFKHSAFISITGVVVPFCLGIGLAEFLIAKDYKADNVSRFHFYLFVGVAMSITAFPVLARLISERHLLGTNLGMLILGSAAVDDFAAWIILSLVVALVKSGSGINALWVFLCALAFFIFMKLFITKLLAYVLKRGGGLDNSRVFVLLLLMALGSAWYTEAIGIHAIFGAFVFGLAMPRKARANIVFAHKIEDFVTTLLLPLYFCKSGIRTNLRTIHTAEDWGACVLIIVVACLGKIIPGITTSKIVGRTWREALVVGFLSNAKGLVELIVLNIGLDLKIISPQVFGMLVMMAVITTLSATPLMYLAYPPHKILADDIAMKAKLAAKLDGEAMSVYSRHNTVQRRPTISKGTATARGRLQDLPFFQNSLSVGRGAGGNDAATAAAAAATLKEQTSSDKLLPLMEGPANETSTDILPMTAYPSYALLFYTVEREAHWFITIAPLISPTPGQPVHMAKVQEVNDLPSSYMSLGAALGEEDESSPSVCAETLLRVRANLLGVDSRNRVIARPWYSDPTEQVEAMTNEFNTGILVLASSIIRKFPNLPRKLLTETDVSVAAVISEGASHLELNDRQPIQQILMIYENDNINRQLLACFEHILVTGKTAVPLARFAVVYPADVHEEVEKRFQELASQNGLVLFKQDVVTVPFSASLKRLAHELFVKQPVDFLLRGVKESLPTKGSHGHPPHHHHPHAAASAAAQSALSAEEANELFKPKVNLAIHFMDLEDEESLMMFMPNELSSSTLV